MGEEPGSPQDDAEDVRRARQGDGEAFARLLGRHSHPLLRLVTRITADPYAAEDILQEATLAAWRRLPSLRDATAFRKWFTAIAVRLAWQYLRAERRRRKIHGAATGDSPSAHDHAARVTDALWVTQALTALPERHRQVVILRYWADLTSREIGKALGIRPGTVRYLLLQARRMVRDEIGESG
ncbi:MAG: sigma-70 family RNA polymerase sigma factor [Bacillota bacterium]|nr:sigma-70 family RNA polymerase sigma factor [Bacillota bacterium]